MTFIPELTTRVSVEVDTSELDNALSIVEGDDILSAIGLSDLLTSAKSRLENAGKQLPRVIAEDLRFNQENIIASKHWKSGMMAQSVDLSSDGDDVLVGDTASSVDGFPYPLAIEKGSNSHWIAPNTFSALHWTDSSGEHWSKGHKVSGIKPDPFVEPSISDTMYDIDSILDDFIGDLI